MAKYQSHKRTSEKVRASQSKTKSSKHKKKQGKAKKKKVFSLGFVSMSLVIAVMIFFAFFIIGMEIGPNLPI